MSYELKKCGKSNEIQLKSKKSSSKDGKKGGICLKMFSECNVTVTVTNDRLKAVIIIPE